MGTLAERLNARYYKGAIHPFNVFGQTVRETLPIGATLLDAGCGRSAPVLSAFRGIAERLIGVDLIDFTVSSPDLELYKADISCVPLADSSIDLVMSRSVMEHVRQPLAAFREMHRLLKPGGHFIFLTANLWDYVSIAAGLIPNRFHPWIVSHIAGRRIENVFPTQYRCNTSSAIRRYATLSGFRVEKLEYLSQYPAYFMFNGFLFLLGTGYEKFINKYSALAFLRGWILADLIKVA
jgi:SAM-dependent methyltransferase